jgi:acetyl esterase/lipase
MGALATAILFGIIRVWQTRDVSRKGLRRTFLRQFIRATGGIPIRSMRALQKPTGVTIASACHSAKISHQVMQVDCGGYPPAGLHFIDHDPKDTGNILLYFHGGGYVAPIHPVQVKFGRLAAQTARANLVILEYTLAPELRYPGQLAQAAAAIQHLLESHKPSEILFGGDSAGGNLSLAVLAHLRKPHPRVPPIVAANEGSLVFRAAMCLSPRCANVRTAPSYKINALKDVTVEKNMKAIAESWQPVGGLGDREVWASPTEGGKEFWKIVHAERVLLTAGGDEVYRDDIQALAEQMEASSQPGSRVQFALCPGEIHVQAIGDLLTGTTDGVMLARVLEWLQSL